MRIHFLKLPFQGLLLTVLGDLSAPLVAGRTPEVQRHDRAPAPYAFLSDLPETGDHGVPT